MIFFLYGLFDESGSESMQSCYVYCCYCCCCCFYYLWEEILKAVFDPDTSILCKNSNKVLHWQKQFYHKGEIVLKIHSLSFSLNSHNLTQTKDTICDFGIEVECTLGTHSSLSCWDLTNLSRGNLGFSKWATSTRFEKARLPYRLPRGQQVLHQR